VHVSESPFHTTRRAEHGTMDVAPIKVQGDWAALPVLTCQVPCLRQAVWKHFVQQIAYAKRPTPLRGDGHKIGGRCVCGGGGAVGRGG
jgi:hypothetical protein